MLRDAIIAMSRATETETLARHTCRALGSSGSSPCTRFRSLRGTGVPSLVREVVMQPYLLSGIPPRPWIAGAAVACLQGERLPLGVRQLLRPCHHDVRNRTTLAPGVTVSPATRLLQLATAGVTDVWNLC